jgi:hypothetical protein
VAVRVRKEDMNRLVMNFLVTEVSLLPPCSIIPARGRMIAT